MIQLDKRQRQSHEPHQMIIESHHTDNTIAQRMRHYVHSSAAHFFEIETRIANKRTNERTKKKLHCICLFSIRYTVNRSPFLMISSHDTKGIIHYIQYTQSISKTFHCTWLFGDWKFQSKSIAYKPNDNTTVHVMMNVFFYYYSSVIIIIIMHYYYEKQANLFARSLEMRSRHWIIWICVQLFNEIWLNFGSNKLFFDLFLSVVEEDKYRVIVVTCVVPHWG